MYINRSRGFTLIELLVVIAIIGILSAVVLASLNTARNRGNDASIQANLSTIQTQAEVHYGRPQGNNYIGLCAEPTVMRAIASAEVSNGAGQGVTCNVAPQEYAVSSVLSTNPSRFWCVDFRGGTSNSITALGTATACPAATP